MNINLKRNYRKATILAILFVGSVFSLENSNYNFVYSQTEEKVKLEPFMSQFITRYDPVKSDRANVLEIIANYTLSDKSLMGSAVNAKLTVFDSNGDSAPLKVTDYPDGFFLEEEGLIVFNSVIDDSPDSVAANVVITDLEGKAKLSNGINLTEEFNNDKDQESILRLEDGRLAVLNTEDSQENDD